MAVSPNVNLGLPTTAFEGAPGGNGAVHLGIEGSLLAYQTV